MKKKTILTCCASDKESLRIFITFKRFPKGLQKMISQEDETKKKLGKS